MILQSQGASLANIVDMTVFLTDMKHYGAMNQVQQQLLTNQVGIKINPMHLPIEVLINSSN